MNPRPSRLALAALLLAAATLTSGAVAAATYRIVELPLPPDAVEESFKIVYSINNADESVGYALRDDGFYHAIAWTAAPNYTPRWLPERAAKTTEAWGISDAGYVIGKARFPDTRGSYVAVAWGPNDALIRLGEPPDGLVGSGAEDINANGTIVGYIQNSNGFVSASWLRPTAAPFVPDLNVNVAALNDSGTVVGYAYSNPNADRTRAFRFTPGGGMELLNGLPGYADSSALDVNEAGQAVGSVVDDTLNVSRAVLWNADGSVLDLGGSGNYYQARDINNAGEVLGGLYSEEFLWTAVMGMQDIVELIDPLDPWYEQLQSGTAVMSIYDINDAGVMVGNLDADDLSIAIAIVPQP